MEEQKLVYYEEFEAHSEKYLMKIFATENGLKAEVTVNRKIRFRATMKTFDILFYTKDNTPVDKLYKELADYIKSQIANKYWKKRYDAAIKETVTVKEYETEIPLLEKIKYHYDLDTNNLDFMLIKLCEILSPTPQTLDEITDKMHKFLTGYERDKLKDEIYNIITDFADNGKVKIIPNES